MKNFAEVVIQNQTEMFYLSYRNNEPANINTVDFYTSTVTVLFVFNYIFIYPIISVIISIVYW